MQTHQPIFLFSTWLQLLNSSLCDAVDHGGGPPSQPSHPKTVQAISLHVCV